MKQGLLPDFNPKPSQHSFVCDICSTAPGSLCPMDWAGYGSHCYLVQRDFVAWSKALSSCDLLGASLATVHSEGEMTHIASLISRGMMPQRERECPCVCVGESVKERKRERLRVRMCVNACVLLLVCVEREKGRGCGCMCVRSCECVCACMCVCV